ncbi:MAG: EF-hand domain-containing protein [Luteolibacter sp.]
MKNYSLTSGRVSKLSLIILVCCCSGLQAQEKAEDRFRELDSNRSGHLEPEEFMKAPELKNLSQEDREKLFDITDKNSDGRISIEEFMGEN